MRINNERSVTGTAEIANKNWAIPPDLMLVKNGLEYGCSELGKNLNAMTDKKEIVETQLHSPKIMKDMLVAALAKVNNNIDAARALKIVCFNETGMFDNDILFGIFKCLRPFYFTKA